MITNLIKRLKFQFPGKIIGIVGLLFMLCQIVFSQGLVIEQGAHFICNENITIVLEDAQFVNNGTYTPSEETIKFTGEDSSSTNTISGESTIRVHTLEIDKTQYGITLGADICIDSLVDMQSGTIRLNGNKIILKDVAKIINEDENSYIYGDSGSVEIIMDISSPTALMPGGLGAELTSTANFGLTTISRTHEVHEFTTGHSIRRSYSIEPTNDAGLDATLRIYYLETELTNINENDLDIWRFDGSTWNRRNVGNAGTDRNTTANWIEESGIDGFSLWTLGSPTAVALPVELIYFHALPNNNAVQLNWTTVVEINNMGFDILHSTNGADWHTIGHVQGSGTINELVDYHFTHHEPANRVNYYKLKQIDFDGNFEFSSIQSVHIANYSEGLAFPNPCMNWVKVSTINSESITLVFTNLKGITVKEIQDYESNQPIDISNLERGVYHVSVVNSSSYSSFLIEKI